MKNNFKNLFALSLILFTAQLFAQAKQERRVESFTKLNISTAITVYLKQGDKTSVEIETDDDKLNKIITEVSGGKLTIKRENSGNDWNYWKNTKVIAYITMKDLSQLEVSGASSIKGESPFKSDNFILKLSGASHVNLDLTASNSFEANLTGASGAELKLSASNVDVDLSGASTLKINGKTQTQKIETSGASNYKAFDLTSKNAEVEASGASSIEISVDDSVSGRASGASSLRYKGNPSKEITNASGGSSVKKVN